MYDVRVQFSPPRTGMAPDGYNLYIDDCAVTGAVGSPVGTVTPGKNFPNLIIADGTYQFCVRPFNSAGEQPDPGRIAIVDINTADSLIPPPVHSIDIQVDPSTDTSHVIDSTPTPLFIGGFAATYDMSQHFTSTVISSLTNILPNGLSYDGTTHILTYDGIGGFSVSQHQLQLDDQVNPVVTSVLFNIDIRVLSLLPIQDISLNIGQTHDMSQYIVDSENSQTATAVIGLSGFVTYASVTELLTGAGLGSESGLILRVTAGLFVVDSNTFNTDVVDSASPFQEDNFDSVDGSVGGVTPSNSGASFWGSSNKCTIKDALGSNAAPNVSPPNSMRFRFPAGSDAFAEQRFSLSGEKTEITIIFDMHIPANYHHPSAGASNNKFLRIWRDSYDDNEKLGGSFHAENAGGVISKISVEYQESPTKGMGKKETAPFILDSDLDSWLAIKIYARAATDSSDGKYEIWKNGVRILNHNVKNNHISGTQGWKQGYLLGWANSGFNEDVRIHMDNVKFFEGRV